MVINLKQKLGEIKRATQIVETLFKYGLSDIFDNSLLGKKFKRIVSRGKKQQEQLTTPERVRLALEELGPTFVKLGQVLSSRPDILPAEYIIELEKLQDHVDPFPFAEAKKIIQSSLGKSLNKVFRHFEEVPVASASIAQVHIARLLNGRKVAVKVKRPNIENIISADTGIILELAKLLKNRDLIDELWQPVEIAEEFKKSIREELDFGNEANNIRKFAANFKNDTNIKVLDVYEDCSTNDVIVMDYIEGTSIKKILKSESARYPKKQIAQIGADAILRQIFFDNFFHGDLHPGNLFWNNPDQQLSFVDFGLAKQLSEPESQTLILLLDGIINKDSDKIVMGVDNLNLLESSRQSEDLKKEIDLLLNKYFNLELKKISISAMIKDVFDAMLKYRVRLPSGLVVLCKTLITVESIAVSLDPDFNVFTFCVPYVKSAVANQFNFKSVKKISENSLMKSARLMQKFPDDFYWLLKNLKNNDFQVKVSHNNLENLLSEISLTGNRMSFSVIVAGLIIGSSYVIPYYHDVGIIGYVLASVAGLSLLVSMFRKNKL